MKHPLYQHSKLAIDLPDISHMGLFVLFFFVFFYIFVLRLRLVIRDGERARVPFSPIEPWALEIYRFSIFSSANL